MGLFVSRDGVKRLDALSLPLSPTSQNAALLTLGLLFILAKGTQVKSIRDRGVWDIYKRNSPLPLLSHPPSLFPSLSLLFFFFLPFLPIFLFNIIEYPVLQCFNRNKLYLSIGKRPFCSLLTVCGKQKSGLYFILI